MIVTVKDFFERFDPTRLKPKIEAIMEDFLDDNWVSSTKIDRLMAILDETRRNYPLEKTIGERGDVFMVR